MSLPNAVLALGLNLNFPVDFERMLALLDEALDRFPKNTTAFLWRTFVYLDIGYLDMAERDARQ